MENSLMMQSYYLQIAMINEEAMTKEEELYSKLKVLGEGSMGKAYLVKSNQDGGLYVMKRINIGHLTSEEKEVAMRQANLHSLVSHPNVVAFKEVYHTTKDKLCIIMEYAQGGDLDEFIRKQDKKLIPEDFVLSLFSQICLGVREIHSKKIIHRDLKGANIFLSNDHRVKIGDFGISKVAEQTVQASKSFVGTPYYLSPEMVEGKNYSAKADIWALGVILYQLCTLKLPFQAHSLPLLALRILKGSFPPVTGPYSREIKSLILSLLQTNQAKRPTIHEILAKPIIAKCTGQSIKVRQIGSKKVIPGGIPGGFPSKKKIEEDQLDAKAKDKEKREKAKEKRDKLRKQMQQQLRAKRKEYQTNNGGPTGKVQKEEQKAEQSHRYQSERKASQKIQKPWKNKKNYSIKNQVQFQIILPSQKRKDPPTSPPPPPLSPHTDFKVEIFVSKKPPQQPLPTQQSQQESHTNSESLEDEDEGESEEERLDGKGEGLNEMLNEVYGAVGAVEGLKDERFSRMQLMEQSEVFDNDECEMEGGRRMQGREESGGFGESSENLEEWRQILEEGLGEQNFIRAYSVLNEYLSSISSSQEGQDESRFEPEAIRERLSFLSHNEFCRYVALLYSLIIMENEEMKKNLSDC